VIRAALRAAALILALPVALSLPLPARAQGDLESLVRHVQRSGCRGALDALTAPVLVSDLDVQRASYLAGWCLAQVGRHGVAAAAYRAASAHPSLRPYARIGEAVALMKVGAADMAAASIRASLAGTNGRLRGRMLAVLAEAELSQSRRAQAVALLQTAAELREDDTGLWRRLSEVATPPAHSDVARRAKAYVRLHGARRLVAEGLWAEAVAELRLVTSTLTTEPAAGEAWHLLGEVLLRLRQRGAVAAFARAAALGWAPPGAPARGYLNAGLRAERAGRNADAAARYQRAIEVAPDSVEAAEARWRLGWLALQGGRHAEAETRFLEAARAADAALLRGEAARALYWAAKAMEARGRAGEGVLRMVAERYPFAYYGARARERLRLPAQTIPIAEDTPLSRDAAAPAYEELAALGLYVEAAAVAEDVLAEAAERDLRLVRFLAEAHSRLGNVWQSVRHAEEALRRGMRDVAVWRLAYPKAYWPEVTAAAQQAGIDPLLLLAIVREESRYDPAVVSPARAVGLAQLLPSTARAMTSDRSMNMQRLKDPRVNLLLGARYVRLQLDRFGGDLRLALAAYNAGPGAARRWTRLAGDPDQLVERINLFETREYVKRVMGSHGVYRLVW
jgi:soluble lytic murein transglycosylase-like protein